jgi:3-hydroxybutyryl-CoA dehydratase
MTPPLAGARVGHALPARTHRVDQALVDRYAKVSGDLNPLHIDPAFAATTHYGRTIAHGMMTLAFASAAMEAWAGPSWAATGVIDATFLAPVFPGDDVAVRGEVTGVSDGTVTVRLECAVAGRTVLAGAATVSQRA